MQGWDYSVPETGRRLEVRVCPHKHTGAARNEQRSRDGGAWAGPGPAGGKGSTAGGVCSGGMKEGGPAQGMGPWF